MKKTNTLYWIFTGLFAALMAFSSIGDILVMDEAVKMVTNELGYPKYFIPFIGVAKLLGAIALLLPGFPRLKEWAYAGLAFDLIAATYSALAVYGASPEMLGMLVFFALMILSYIYHHKRLRAAQA